MKTAKEIMNKNLVTLPENETILKASNTMKQEDVKEIPLVDNKNRLKGMITYYDILDFVRADPEEKISTLKFMPPTVEEDESIESVARLMLRTAVEAIPVVKDEKIVGIISDYDLLNAYKQNSKIKSMKVKDVMEEEINLLKEDETISRARRIMRFNNWDRLPVIDGEGKNLGLVLSLDIIETFFTQPKEKMSRADKSGNRDNPFAMPVKSIMRKNIPEISLNDDLSEAIEKLLDKKLKGAQVLDKNRKVVGAIFRINVLDSLIEKKVREGVWIKFSGLLLKTDTLEALKKYLGSEIRKLKTLMPDLETIKIHIKKLHGATEEKWNYEIDVMLVTASGNVETVTNQKAHYGYNLRYTLQEALDRLCKLVERKYGKRESKQH